MSVVGVGTILEWREHEHELNDNITMDDPPTLDAMELWVVENFPMSKHASPTCYATNFG
jgi:hypothetical protein